MKNYLKWLPALTLYISPIIARAQDTAIDLDPVSVTSSLQPKNTSKTGRNITVIRGADFTKLPVHSLDELLRYVPGIEVQSRGPAGSQSDIVMRGGTFQQVLVILDGLRLNDPNTGHFNSYIPIAPSEIDRIEILKGASSAIYGSEAVGGVIHVISKTFAAKENQNKKEFMLQGAAGEYGLLSFNVGGYFQNEKTSIGTGIVSNNANGQTQRGTRGYFHNSTASVSAGHIFNDRWRLALRSSFDKRDFSAQNFYTTFRSDTASEIVKSQWNQLSLIYQQSNTKFIIDAGYKKVSDHFTFNKSSVANNNISKLLQASARLQNQLTNSTSLITGVQFQSRDINSNDRGDHNLKQLAGFVLVDKSWRAFTFVPALRIDYTENSGTELVPQLNISYRKKNMQLRASAGKTIRQADFTERYNNYNKALVTSGSIGNPFLEAETSFSYEAGIDYFISKNLKLSSSVFRRDHEKLIDFTPTPYSQIPRKENLSPTGTYALAKNIAKVNTTGFETDLQFRKQINGDQQMQVNAGLLWLDSETGEAVPSFYISSHAKFLMNFSLLYSNKYVGLSMNGLYKNRKAQNAPAINAQVSKDYFVMNLKGNLFLMKNRSSLFLQVDNLLDRKYSDLLGSPMPGRWLSAGFTVNLVSSGQASAL